MKTYRLIYFSYNPNPWKELSTKMWKHHSDIWRIINEKFNKIEIHTMTMPTSSNKIRKYENGDKSVIEDGYENIDFIFHDINDTSFYKDMDGAFLEVSRMFKMHGSNNEDDYNKFMSNIRIIMDLELPILWYDGDADLREENNKKMKFDFAYHLFDDLNLIQYHNITVIGPYEKRSSVIGNSKFICVPYNIDFRTLMSIDDVSSDGRDLFCSYIGNNFKRNNFIPIFNNISKYGSVNLFGYGWDKFENNSGINVNGVIKSSDENIGNIYKRTLFGPYGTAQSFLSFGHFTLRITEYLKYGVYIVPQNCDYLTSKFPNHNINLSDFVHHNIKRYNHFEVIKLNDKLCDKISDIRYNYRDCIESQRKSLKNYFDSNSYVNVYRNALRMEEL